MNGALRVAAGQCGAVPGDVQANLESLERLTRDAAEAGADLLVLPEMILTGYGIGAEAVSRLAEPLDGPMLTRVGEIARDHGVALCLGHPERDGQDVYNSASFFDEHGERLTGGRKMHMFGDVDVEQFTRGDAVPAAARWHGTTVATAICYDIEFPETARALASAGAQLLCVPTANMVGFDVVSRLLVPARAAENQVFVVYANHTGTDPLFEYNGLSVVVGPDGQPLGTAGRGAEMVLADVDVEAIGAARAENDYLADRRSDLFG
ncbi:MAG: carbon-nitrogen hydrolase family protein [Nesterenkonia sp.]|nr:carbon-nitrogen hydrolase family protein [Nesterenkonia sp.]